MKRPRRPGGLQFEIVANLFVVMLAGLAIVAVVMGGLAVATVERAAHAQLQLEALHLQRAKLIGGLRLSDLAALARTLPSGASKAKWTVRDVGGRGVGPRSDDVREDPALERLVAEALATRKPARAGSAFSSDLVLVVPLAPGGGVLVGTVARQALLAELQPLLASGAWVLATAATVFVVFGAYLLRLRIVTPVRALSAATARVARGDLGARTDAQGSDELAELGRSFDRMAESLSRERAALRRTEQSLARSERLATVGQLAAGMAHEVGNPVAAILGYAELALRDAELSPRSRDGAERIRAEALRIRVLVQDMLDLASGGQLEVAPCPPAELVLRVVERMRSQQLLEALELCEIVEPATPLVLTDASRVEQILVNLIENAAHALAGQSGGRIELRTSLAYGLGPSRRYDDLSELDGAAERRADAVAIAVLDNGPGIDSEHQSRIFDPFFTTKEPGKGTGLGLWNAHRLAELVGGRLELESAPGRTCFSLLLPLADNGPAPEGADGSTTRTDH